MICVIGMPMLFMEYAFGQYFGIGSLSIFKKICPLFQGEFKVTRGVTAHTPPIRPPGGERYDDTVLENDDTILEYDNVVF